jgi:hypothetical protein
VSATASRNVANVLIVVGLLPVLLWLYGLVLLVFDPGDLLPWTAAAIIMFGAPLGLFSLFVTAPVLMFAHTRASQNKAVWTPIHRVPFYFALVTFATALFAGMALIVTNVHT